MRGIVGAGSGERDRAGPEGGWGGGDRQATGYSGQKRGVEGGQISEDWQVRSKRGAAAPGGQELWLPGWCGQALGVWAGVVVCLVVGGARPWGSRQATRCFGWCGGGGCLLGAGGRQHLAPPLG